MMNISINKEKLEIAKQEWREDKEKLLLQPNKSEIDYQLIKLYEDALNFNDFSDMGFFNYDDVMTDISNNYRIIKDDKDIDNTKFVVVDDINNHYCVSRYSDYKLETIKPSEWKLYNMLPYGVCDNASQILNYFTPKEDEVVLMVPVIRKFESEIGGWRWHKWGTYIGVQNPTHEYIYDDTDIDVVFCFTVYKIIKQEDN